MKRSPIIMCEAHRAGGARASHGPGRPVLHARNIRGRRSLTRDGEDSNGLRAYPEARDIPVQGDPAPAWLVHDLKVAEEVQHRLLPQSVPRLPDYDFFTYYRAAYEVGGDYYDFVPMSGDRLGIALGDVSGKGVAAALIMAKFSGDTRHALRTCESPSTAAAALNEAICEVGLDERYITLSLSVLNTRTGRLQVCSAGHPPLLLRRAEGTVEELTRGSGCLPLGIMPGAAYAHIEVELRPGDVAVIYSDGVTDARSPGGWLFDTHEQPRLRRVLEETDGAVEAVGWAILRAVQEFSRGQPQADDLTLVCFGRTEGRSSGSS